MLLNLNKMLTIKFKPALILICVFLVIISCKKNNDEKENAFVVNEKIFLTPNGNLLMFPPQEDGRSFSITLTDASFLQGFITGDFTSVVNFDIKSPSTTELSSGEYTFNNDLTTSSFGEGYVLLYGICFDISDGTVNIGKSGETYEIIYDITIGDNTIINGYFKGPLQ